MNANTTSNPAKVITGKCRLSYAHLFEPVALDEKAPKKYSCSIIIPKSDKETIEKIKAAIEAAKEAGRASKWKGKIPANLKLPLRDGDEERPDDEAYADSYFVNASSATRPGIIDLAKNKIDDPEDLYSGCWCRFSLNFFAFDTAGNRGIGCGLNNVQKVADGDFLGGRSKAEDDFDDDYEDDDDDLF